MQFKFGKNFPVCQFLYLYSMKTMVMILCMATLLSCVQRTEDRLFEEKVTTALKQQVERYPQSTIRDIYRIFQDKFGPGHLLSDTAAAGRYLRRELDSYDCDLCRHCLLMSTVPAGSIVLLVDLRVIKRKGQLRGFFNAFVRRCRQPVVSVEDWSGEWNRIVEVLEKLQCPVTHHPHYTADKDSLSAMLQRGEYVGHHSRDYVVSYAPHYRLIAVEELQSLGL